MRYLSLIPVLVVLLITCKKNDFTSDTTDYSIPLNAPIRFIASDTSGYIVGGGERGGKGFLYSVDANLNIVKLLSDTFPWPIFSGSLLNGRYVFGTEDGTILYSRDLNTFFTHWLNEKNFVPDLHQQPGRKVIGSLDKSITLICSGGEYEYGLIQISRDTFQSWVPIVFENELRSVHFASDGSIWAAGFGILLKSKDKGISWERNDFNHVFSTDIKFNTAHNGIMSSFDGNFYFTENGGDKWIKARVKGKSGSINALEYITDNQIVAVGNNGIVCTSKDGGKNWECYKEFDSQDLYDLIPINGQSYIAVGEDGGIWKVQI